VSLPVRLARGGSTDADLLIGEARDRQRARRRRNGIVLLVLAIAAGATYLAVQSPRGGDSGCTSSPCGNATAHGGPGGPAEAQAIVARSSGGLPRADLALQFQSVFLSPLDANIAPAAASALESLVAQANRAGLPLKVAVIVGRTDLGPYPIFLGRPQPYAQFLAQEDAYYWQNELVVVMPNGYGLYKADMRATGSRLPVNQAPAADIAALRSLSFERTSNGNALVDAAERAVTRLAALHGIHSPRASASP